MPVAPPHALGGLRERLEPQGVNVVYEQAFTTDADVEPVPSDLLGHMEGGRRVTGVLAEYYANETLEGDPVVTRVEPGLDLHFVDGSPDAKVPADHFSMRFRGVLTPREAGRYLLSAFSGDGFRLFIEGRKVLDVWNNVAPNERSAVEMPLRARPYEFTLEAHERTGQAYVRFDWGRAEASTERAVRIARASSAAVLFMGLSQLTEAEGWDHKIELPKEQVQLIKAVARVNPRTVVVMHNGSALLVSDWIEGVPALVEAWYPGQAGGQAIAEALVGDISPSGKLPVTFLRRWEDSAAYPIYPGTGAEARYEDGIYVGYRHVDKAQLPVAFPFGHGLSYVPFAYTDVKVLPVEDAPRTFDLSLKVQNKGRLLAAEVVQVYVSERKPLVDRPPQELKGFAKVHLAPGEEKDVRVRLDARAFSFYDVKKGAWHINPGVFDLRIGASSRDIRLAAQVEIE